MYLFNFFEELFPNWLHFPNKFETGPKKDICIGARANIVKDIENWKLLELITITVNKYWSTSELV